MAEVSQVRKVADDIGDAVKTGSWKPGVANQRRNKEEEMGSPKEAGSIWQEIRIVPVEVYFAISVWRLKLWTLNQENNLNFNIDFSVSNFENCGITTSALHTST
jgi:hypothetical protein